ncbi:MAG: PDZ domain-containing protein [Planctomycetes bacterium]|nr:PDZ domain-containing protein [Planctomycetota bacterium]
MRIRPSIAALALAAALGAVARADEQAVAMRKAVERHAAALVRVEATATLGVEGLPGLGRGARRTHEVSTAGVVVAGDGLVVFPAAALDPAGDVFALLGARPRAEVLAISVVGADGRVRDAEWVGRDLALGLGFLRVVEAGRAGLAPVTFGQAAPDLGDPLLVLSVGPARLERPRRVDAARVSYRTARHLGTTPRLPHALGGLVVALDGTPLGLLAPLAAPTERPDLLTPDLLAEQRAGHVLLAPAFQALVASPPVEPGGPVAAASRARAWLGIKHEVLTPELAQVHGLDVDTGVRVAAVYDGPAKVAGLQPGDVLQTLDGEPLDLDPGESFDDLIEDFPVGSKVTLGVRRRGQARQVEVELARGPVRPRDAERAALPEVGLLVRALTFHDREDAGLPHTVTGAVVLEVEPDGAASRAGLRPGDLLLEVAGAPVAGLGDLRARLVAPGAHALKVRRRGEELTLRVRR